jgi:tellurite resistance protein TerC
MNWILFNLFVLAMLAIDLGVFHRKAHEVKLKEALAWSGVWIALAMVFNVGLYFWQGPKPALEFLTGYVIEKSLSVDNIFVFVMIFSYFRVPPLYQHKVLFWGILSALVMRAVLIVIGAALIAQFHWIIYVFGGFLVITGIKMLAHGDEPMDPEKNIAVRLFRKFVPMTPRYHESKFVIQEGGKWVATPLLLVLAVIEATDLIFAVDSIPAIFAVTGDPFIVYTSNVFAILGLRSLYFALAGIMDKFRYLKVGLSCVLMFVGIKMLLMGWIKIPISISLSVVAGILSVAVLASLWVSRGQPVLSPVKIEPKSN